MNYQVLSLNESTEWNRLLQTFPAKANDVYLSPEFFKLFQNKYGGTACCFVFQQGDDHALYPFLLNTVNTLGFKLEDTFYDIQAPYGYNGMVTTSSTPQFLEQFGNAFQNFCSEKKIIAELVRFNPIFKNEKFMPHLDILNVLDNVSIDLSKGYKSIWENSFEGKVKKAVRKAESYNLTFEHTLCGELTDEKMAWFKKLYTDTMSRNEAKRFYYFNDDFFAQLPQVLPSNAIVVFVFYEGKPVSTQLVLFRGEIAHGYLGGTSEDAYHVKPNVYLFHKLLSTLCDMGLKYYSMGGGISRHDSLYRYKKSFNKINPVQHIYLGSKIYNKPVYDNVIAQWTKKFPHLTDRYQNYVLKYRYSS